MSGSVAAAASSTIRSSIFLDPPTTEFSAVERVQKNVGGLYSSFDKALEGKVDKS